MCICHVLSQTIHMDRKVQIGRGTTSLRPFEISAVPLEIPLRLGVKRSPLRCVFL